MLMHLYYYRFSKIGKRVIFDPFSDFTYHTIEMGNDVYIGPNAKFISPESVIKIGNKVMFGPEVMLLGGDHNTSILGSYMIDISEKLPENDLPIVIEDDVWVGARAIILKGVTLHTGCIIAAGALVTKDVPPYTIYGGVPARFLKNRFSENDIKIHVAKLNNNDA